MIYRTVSGLIASAMLVFICQGCFPSKNKASEKVFNNGDSWIPPDFNPQKSVLLVQLLNEDVANSGWRTKFQKWNNEMKEYMQEKYPHKYEFVSADDIQYKGKKYSDYQKYPYGLMISDGSVTYYGGAAGTGPDNKNTRAAYDYYFLDRATGKKYPLTKKYSTNPVLTFMPVINTILAGR
jgi:hypothetical protein